ncbi:MAG: VWA domain-containing protein [Planctomycetota bacterium]|nr:VWA domain-containing protein [Planctomycetota bacterium]
MPSLKAAYLDRDRRTVENQADDLESSGRWISAADLLADRSTRPASATWTDAIKRRECLDLVQAAAEASDTDKARSILVRARQVAASANITLPLIDALFRRLHAESQLADTSQRERRVTADLQGTRSHSRLLAETLHSVLLSCGDNPQLSPMDRKGYYEQALQVAQKHALDSTGAEAKLREIGELLTNLTPMAVPAGSRAAFVAFHVCSEPRVMSVDFTLASGRGEHLPGLQTKDLTAHFAEREGRVLALSTTSTPTKPLSVVLLHDCSTSTKGPPELAGHQGMKQMLGQLPPGTQARLYSFATDVTVHGEWTNNLTALASRVDTFVVGGNTALHHALDAAVRDLAQRENPRAIVVFTDGRDNRGGPTLDQILDRCREHQITVWTIGLITPDLDGESLKRAADRTGGKFLYTDRVGDLAARFSEIATQLIQPAYRATVLAPTAKPVPFTLTIGGANQLQLEVAPPSSP